MIKKLNKKRSLEKGITLIVLVITIIILLILAAISIVTLTGENGILKKAQIAKEKTDQATAKEKVQVAVLGSYGTDGILDYKKLKTNLEKVEGISDVPDKITEESFNPELIVYVDKYKVRIDKNGTVTIEGEKSENNNKEDEEGLVLYTRFNDEASYENQKYVIQGDQQITITNNPKIGEGSCYFPGTASQRLNQKVTDLNFRKNDFTLELWAYAKQQVMSHVLLIGTEPNSNLQFFLNHPGMGGKLGIYLDGYKIIETTKTYTVNEWVHYAIVRKDGIFTLYENGKPIGTSSESYKDLEVNISDLAIGGNCSITNTAYIGYVDELAIYNYAKYNETFIPTIEAKTDANILYSSFDTEIDLRIKGIKDSVTGKLYKNLGNTNIYITEKESKTEGKSVYFSGEVGQRLNQTIPGLNFKKEDFTIELWVYAEPQIMSYVLLIGTEPNSNLQFFLNHPEMGGKLGIFLDHYKIIETTKTYTANEWVHYAIVRKDGIFTLYENGKAIGTSSESYKDLEVDISNLAIGGNCSITNTAYKGYIDDLVIYKKAKYTTDFEINN